MLSDKAEEPIVPNPITIKHLQLLVLLVVSLLTSSAISAQEATEKNALLTKFKKRYQQINQYKKYKTVSIENSEEILGDCSVNGGNLLYLNDPF